jgi:Ca-activated chloride channel family protein
VSFQEPLLLLLGLALLPAAALYLQATRRRQAFASPALLPAVAPRRPGLRRHWPILLYALGLAALIVAIARPQRAVSVPVERASVMLVSDRSGSMQAKDVEPDRLTAARRAAETFLAKVPKRVRVGLIAFNQVAEVSQLPTADRAAVRGALGQITPAGGTATGDAIKTALNVLTGTDRPGQKPPPAAIVLLTDGASVRGRDPVAVAQEARKAKIPVYTVALGTPAGTIQVPRPDGTVETRPVPPDPESLRRIAETSGGRAFTAGNAGELDAVYRRLGSQVARKKEQRQVTSAFAGGALLLVVLGAALSLLWFGRLP